jgi:hypothetical protein
VAGVVPDQWCRTPGPVFSIGAKMPKGTKVHKCVGEVKEKGVAVNPYAVCQKSTGQSYKTGKKLKKK